MFDESIFCFNLTHFLVFDYVARPSIDDPELLLPNCACLAANYWSKCQKPWLWFSDDPKNQTFPKTSLHIGVILILSPASLIEHLHKSCSCCPLPVSFSLPLLPTAFCAWMTAMKHSLISTAIFQGTPNEKILPTFSLPYTAPHKCWQETAIPSLTFYRDLWTRTIPITDETFESAESEMVWRNLMAHNVSSILVLYSQTVRCTICP